jgi:signal transduction histidine kinase/ActR/RegA family two-component response regulator
MNLPTSEPENPEQRVLVLAPTGRDTQLACDILASHGIPADPCDDIRDLAAKILEGAGAALVTEESLTGPAIGALAEALERQPRWSEFPIMIFTSELTSDTHVRSIEQLGTRASVTLIDRPIHIKTLVSAARSVLRAREHQYDIRDLLEELEERVSERDQFLALLGHELRNPLYAIVLAAEESDEEDPDLLRSKMKVIERQARRLRRLVDDLLDVARVTRGKIELRRRKRDLREVVQRCVEEMKPTVERSGITLTIDLADAPVPVEVDEVRMEQVLTNLLTNSMKYSPPGGQIEVIVGSDDEGAFCCVRDDGDGIEPEILPHIFDLFAQASTRKDIHQGGLGIGLTLVRSLVELHGGTVSAESDGPGMGCTMIVRLPLAEGAIDAPVKSLPYGKSSRPAATRRIVIVEDNEDIRTLLSAGLTRLGHQVETAGDGPGALDLVAETRPDVALIDIGLPGLNGHEVARRIRSEGSHPILLVALTGYGQPEDREQALEAGFDEHLTKPIDIRRLQKLIERRGERAEAAGSEKAASGS